LVVPLELELCVGPGGGEGRVVVVAGGGFSGPVVVVLVTKVVGPVVGPFVAISSFC